MLMVRSGHFASSHGYAVRPEGQKSERLLREVCVQGCTRYCIKATVGMSATLKRDMPSMEGCFVGAVGNGWFANLTLRGVHLNFLLVSKRVCIGRLAGKQQSKDVLALGSVLQGLLG